MAANVSMTSSVTPKNRNTRVSGLRRANNRKVSSTTPIRVSTTTPQSDGKIKELTKTQTPEVLKDAKRQTLSANISRPYNLALSKKIREKMTKKRLEFQLPKDADTENNKKENHHGVIQSPKKKCQGNAKVSPSDENEVPKKDTSKEELPLVVDEMELCMEERRRHLQRVEDLKKAIGTWKTGFVKALDDFQQKFQPHLTKEQLLQQLRIDQQMIQYLNNSL